MTYNDNYLNNLLQKFENEIPKYRLNITNHAWNRAEKRLKEFNVVKGQMSFERKCGRAINDFIKANGFNIDGKTYYIEFFIGHERVIIPCLFELEKETNDKVVTIKTILTTNSIEIAYSQSKVEQRKIQKELNTRAWEKKYKKKFNK